MPVDAPERIWAVASLGMVGTGRWVTQGSENPHGNVEYVRADKLEELAAENERLWVDLDDCSHALRKQIDKTKVAEAALAEAERENEALREALERLVTPAPGVKALPAWVYGIVNVALRNAGGNDGE